jgi:hypothetical protein
MQNSTAFILFGQLGNCAGFPVFIGFAPVNHLYLHSVAAFANERVGRYYQNLQNSPQDKKDYTYLIQKKTPTIPLTFNLRGNPGKEWDIEKGSSAQHKSRLFIAPGCKPLIQINYQAQLAGLSNSDEIVAFMTFVGLDLEKEGTLHTSSSSDSSEFSSSHENVCEIRVMDNLIYNAPHMFIAQKLNEDRESPWFRMIKYGGETSSGLKRRVTLRMMQQTTFKLLKSTNDTYLGDVHSKYRLINRFWLAIRSLFGIEWNNPRQFLLTKGLGLYSLSDILVDIIRQSSEPTLLTVSDYRNILGPLSGRIDWSSHGPLSGVRGKAGAETLYHRMRKMVLS